MATELNPTDIPTEGTLPGELAPGEVNALLGRGTEYQGKLTFEGRVRIDGHFEGEVFSDGILIVGPEAKLKGSLAVGTLIALGGRIEAAIEAKELVELHGDAHVTGDIRTGRLFIDRSVTFEGQCTMDGHSPSEKHELESEKDTVEKALESTMSDILPEPKADTDEDVAFDDAGTNAASDDEPQSDSPDATTTIDEPAEPKG